METAPLFEDSLGIGEAGTACWIHTEDNVRLRVCVWNEDAPLGTILIFPGRAEFIEKYASAAAEFGARGYAVAMLDWRGQGLSDRQTPKGSLLGHVDSYASYQNDVKAFLGFVSAQNLPEPRFLLGHSMGGMIAFRSLANGYTPRALCLTAPMWKVKVAPLFRPIVWLAGTIAELIGYSKFRLPGTSVRHYTLSAPFEGNKLTTNPEVFKQIGATLRKHPELELGGPSLGWLRAGQKEGAELAKLPSPNVPTLVLLGGRERIIDLLSVTSRMSNWSNSQTHQYSAAEHEVLMEVPEIADNAFDRITEFFGAQTREDAPQK